MRGRENGSDVQTRIAGIQVVPTPAPATCTAESGEIHGPPTHPHPPLRLLLPPGSQCLLERASTVTVRALAHGGGFLWKCTSECSGQARPLIFVFHSGALSDGSAHAHLC